MKIDEKEKGRGKSGDVAEKKHGTVRGQNTFKTTSSRKT